MKERNGKVTGDQCAALLGVGQSTVIAVKKMLGISGVRKVFVEPVEKFLRRYPDFQIKDADDMAAFKQRHPEFHLPTNRHDDTHANHPA